MHTELPYPALAQALLPNSFDTIDGAHDGAHLLRVWRNVVRISVAEGGDLEVLQAATLLHDCIWVDKRSPRRSMASTLAAEKAREVLGGLGWGADRRDGVCHAIEAHSYSAGIAPRTLEARILQDADRLDAIGFIGAALCFYIAGASNGAICDAIDPAAEHRPLDEAAFALDHFRTKLLTLGRHMQTATGSRLAEKRTQRLAAVYDGLLDEVG
ncbi:HD domain-containing protein [Pelagovum pacificum]|uniref:HD domain-containing protein n=1 Tax=Pelagovum pacificum TaxID=2588711 RepID=A0A5C5GEJ6_9RHOB|nr:HD domain-containing protein [Pelagovum pacificum]QQA44507.1 HD domain-containing protein [Pelagovum pacificum]TNY32379.1 HD domain-containing protein [Pelagovum pacificum]